MFRDRRDEAFANDVAPADRNCCFKAIADGLDRIPRDIRNGVAKVAHELMGMPRFFAEVLGEMASRIVDPLQLDTMVMWVRIVGTVASAAEGEILRSAVARDLAGAMFENALQKAMPEPPDPTEPPDWPPDPGQR